jgi:hypothetical protein
MKKILVIGAKGVMGKRIVALTEKLLPQVRVFKASRNVDKTDSFYRYINIFDEDSIDLALSDINLVINAVGPFFYDPTILLRSCLKKNCHYIDIAETKEFIDRVNKLANEFNTSCVLSGCSTIPGVTDVFAQGFSNKRNLSKIEVFLSVGSSNKISSTLIYSFLQPFSLELPNNAKLFSKLVEKYFNGIGKRLYGNYLSTYDLSGANVGNKIVPLNFYISFDKPFYSYLLILLSKIFPLISEELLKYLSKIFYLPTPLINAIGSPIGILLIEALGEKNEILAKIEIQAKTEGLNVPAIPTVWAAEKLLFNNISPPNKALTLDKLYNTQEILELLKKEGCEVYAEKL